MDAIEYLKVFVALLFMVDPLAAIPTYLAATAGDSKRERARTTRTAAIAVAALLGAFCLGGEIVLELFGIGIDSFRVAGGIILMLLALSMVTGTTGATKQRPEEAEEAVVKESVGVVPLAIPLLAGPGAMSFMIVNAHQQPSWTHRGILVGIGVGVAVAVWLSLMLAEPLRRILGRTGLNIATRLMGIIVAAVAVEFITGGLVGLMPGLAGTPPTQLGN